MNSHYVWQLEEQNILNNYRYEPVEGMSFKSRESARQTAKAHNLSFENKVRVVKYISAKYQGV